MDVSTYGVAFEAYNTDSISTKPKQNTSEEDSFESLLKESNKTENHSYQTNIVSEDSTSTSFTDPTNGKLAIVSLENETIDKLKKHFEEDDFIKNEDGSLRLSDKAEKFVASWFADIAYNRDFLKADANNDGSLSEDEYSNTKNNFGIEAVILTQETSNSKEILYSGEKVVEDKKYVSSLKSDDPKNTSYRNYREFDDIKSLDDELNTTLQIDKDFDSKITLKEAYSTKGDVDAKTVQLRHIKEFGIVATESNDSYNTQINASLISFLDNFLQAEEKERKELVDQMIKDIMSLLKTGKTEDEIKFLEELLAKIQEANREKNNRKEENDSGRELTEISASKSEYSIKLDSMSDSELNSEITSLESMFDEFKKKFEINENIDRKYQELEAILEFKDSIKE